jgi:hypothetical protein
LQTSELVRFPCHLQITMHKRDIKLQKYGGVEHHDDSNIWLAALVKMESYIVWIVACESMHNTLQKHM